MSGFLYFAKSLASLFTGAAGSLRETMSDEPWQTLMDLWQTLMDFQPEWASNHAEPPYLENVLEPGESGCKQDVDLDGLQPIMYAAWVEVAACYDEFDKPCIVTSALDGVHSANSLHYSGYALDFRTRHVPPADRRPLRNMIKTQLDILADKYNATEPERPVRFDVVLEKTHIHVECDEA